MAVTEDSKPASASLRSWLQTKSRTWALLFFACYRGTGGRITYVSPDWREVHVRVPLNWRTRNYVGTIFGGSMYGAIDPIYMIMLIKILGPGYIVWDKTATIRFKKPGKKTLTAVFRIPVKETEEIQRLLETERSLDRTYTVDLVDEDGVVCATVEKTEYIRKK